MASEGSFSYRPGSATGEGLPRLRSGGPAREQAPPWAFSGAVALQWASGGQVCQDEIVTRRGAFQHRNRHSMACTRSCLIRSTRSTCPGGNRGRSSGPRSGCICPRHTQCTRARCAASGGTVWVGGERYPFLLELPQGLSVRPLQAIPSRCSPRRHGSIQRSSLGCRTPRTAAPMAGEAQVRNACKGRVLSDGGCATCNGNLRINPARIDVQPSQDTTVIRMYCAMTGVAKRASNSPLASVNVALPSALLHAESSVLCWTVNAVTFWLTSERACARTP